jgi:hypothetical protein
MELIDMSVEWKYTTNLRKSEGYQEKTGQCGTITFSFPRIWQLRSINKTDYHERYHLADFIYTMIRIQLCERICVERAFQHIKMKARCKNFQQFGCKMDYITQKLMDVITDELLVSLQPTIGDL